MLGTSGKIIGTPFALFNSPIILHRCGYSVWNWTDPHSHLDNEVDWHHMGLAHPLDLPDGVYYVTVKAQNEAVFGGAFVTTVCHAQVGMPVPSHSVHFRLLLSIEHPFHRLLEFLCPAYSLNVLAALDFFIGCAMLTSTSAITHSTWPSCRVLRWTPRCLLSANYPTRCTHWRQR